MNNVLKYCEPLLQTSWFTTFSKNLSSFLLRLGRIIHVYNFELPFHRCLSNKIKIFMTEATLSQYEKGEDAVEMWASEWWVTMESVIT